MSTSHAPSTSVRFPCPECDQLLSVVERKIGRNVRCPKCKIELVVPSQQAADEALADRRDRHESSSQADDPFADMVVYDDAPLTYDASYDEPRQETDRQTSPVDHDRVSISRSVIYGQGILIAAVALVAFTMGFFIGRLAGTDPDKKPSAADRGPTTIRGRLVHKNAARKDVGDDGAVVIVLPRGVKQKLTSGRLATSGLSPGEPAPAMDDPNVRAISDLGGVYLRTDETGHFQFALRPGRYHVLLISHNALRAQSELLAARDLQSMGDLLTDVDALIGPYKYRWRSDVEIAKATTLDYSFE